MKKVMLIAGLVFLFIFLLWPITTTSDSHCLTPKTFSFNDVGPVCTEPEEMGNLGGGTYYIYKVVKSGKLNQAPDESQDTYCTNNDCEEGTSRYSWWDKYCLDNTCFNSFHPARAFGISLLGATIISGGGFILWHKKRKA